MLAIAVLRLSASLCSLYHKPYKIYDLEGHVLGKKLIISIPPFYDYSSLSLRLLRYYNVLRQPT